MHDDFKWKRGELTIIKSIYTLAIMHVQLVQQNKPYMDGPLYYNNTTQQLNIFTSDDVQRLVVLHVTYRSKDKIS